MNMKLLVSIVLVAIASGCASTPARKPVLPPLPPGFKPAKVAPAPAPAARFSPASTDTSLTPGSGIMQAPEIYNDPDFGKLFVARAYQGPNTVLTVDRTSDLSTYFPVAVFDCWSSEQVFLVASTGEWPFLALRGRHTTCAVTDGPTSPARLGPSHNFRLRSGHVKAARIEGTAVAAGFSIWKVLP